MIDKIYIRCREVLLPADVNFYAAWEGFRQLGVEIGVFQGFGDIAELTDLGPRVALSGYVGDVLDALRQVGATLPAFIDYPKELQSLFGRRIWRSTLSEARTGTFIKPVQHKLFTGRIWTGSTRDHLDTGDAADTPVWMSEVVQFLAEYRVFVLEGEILDVRRYKGDWSMAPSREAAEWAVKHFTEAPAAFALDLGVIGDGRTLLVEANDAFALGSYGIQPALYARMIAARWEQLTASCPQ